jgi:hypothetical protein
MQALSQPCDPSSAGTSIATLGGGVGAMRKSFVVA